MAAFEAGTKHEPLCSQCDPEIGKWHDQFPREGITSDWLQDKRGMLWRPSEIKNMEHIGPFTPVSI